MHEKYKVSVSYGSNFMAKIKVFYYRHVDRQTGQKVSALKFHSWSKKNYNTLYMYWSSFLKEYVQVIVNFCYCASYFTSKFIEKSRCVCETLTMPPAATKENKAIFKAKVKVKVTRSLTLVSFERASLV